MSLTIALETLGCKVNQYETSYMVEALEEGGHSIVSFKDRADIYVVHGCAVTSRASYETRQLLRRGRKMNPKAALVAVGCEAQRDPGRLAREKLATHILGNSHKHDILRHLSVSATMENPFISVTSMVGKVPFHPLPVKKMYKGRTRAYLKIQDGCNAFCSYCVVPFTRGRSRSLEPLDVLEQAVRFLNHGYRELVLTGINLGQWGRDLTPPMELADLLQGMDAGKKPSRLRLSSLEPGEWTPRLLGAMPNWKWLCPHFHVPLQSGSDEILQLMERPYKRKEYWELVQTLRSLFPHGALGADVLVGFPGETGQHFAATLEFVESLPLTYLHVFPFSPRPGTKAFSRKDRVTGPELKLRARALQELSLRKRVRFQETFMGKWVNVLVESQVEEGWWRGTSSNYLQVVFQGSSRTRAGSMAKVHISHQKGAVLMGAT